MDLNNFLESFNDEFGCKFDDIKKTYKHNLDIGSLFNLENTIIKEIQSIKEKSQNLDLIYCVKILKYNNILSQFYKCYYL